MAGTDSRTISEAMERLVEAHPRPPQLGKDVELAMHLYEVLGLDLRPSEVKALRELLAGQPQVGGSIVLWNHLRYIHDTARILKFGGESNLPMEEEWARVVGWAEVIARELGGNLS